MTLKYSRIAAATLFVIVAGALLVASCDGVLWTGEPLRNQSPAGIYTGFVRSTVTMPAPNRMVIGVISEDSQVHLIQGFVSQYSGVVSVDGDKLTGTLTEYLGAQARFFGFDGVQSITLAGTVSEHDSVSGDYSGDDDDGFFSLDYEAKYERASSLDQTSGVWTFDMSSSGGAIYNVTLDIDPDGRLFGMDTNGCVFSGALSIIDGRYNAYKVIVSMASCGPVDGDFSGLAYRGDFAAGGPTAQLFLFFANGRYAFSTIFSQ